MGATGKYLQAINSAGRTENIPIYWDKDSIYNFASDYVRIGGTNTTDGYMYLPAIPTSDVASVLGQGRRVIDVRPNYYYRVSDDGGTYSQIFEYFSFNMPRDGYLSTYIDYDMSYSVAELPHVVFFYRIDESMSLTANAPSGETAITHFFGNDMMSGAWKYRDWTSRTLYNVVLVNNDIWLSAGTHTFKFGIYQNASADDISECSVYRYSLDVRPKCGKCNASSVHAIQGGREFTLVYP